MNRLQTSRKNATGLGVRAFRVRASFMPGKALATAGQIERFQLHTIDLPAHPAEAGSETFGQQLSGQRACRKP
jgi:2'-deoxycytidine 5'-triphosphate deaminase (DCD)